ncbi:MAG TPA: carbohydrate binding domain-containing protein [Pyrinomonadaceae bacterium]|nr:carbohydrate binding domain-containing protein [Pyrinomonadaceae bacterium]
MSLKILKLKPGIGHIVIFAIGVLFVIAAYFFIKWNFANLIATRIDTTQPEAKIVADWIVQTAPDDPLTHYAAAIVYERTFEPDDLTRSLAEYETSVAAAPHNYLVWINLGRARDRSGDETGAEKAFARALALAPNYASVKWAYGNSLIRHQKMDEGFAMIAAAAASDTKYANPASSIALQVTDGDVTQARRLLGDTPDTNAALADVLVTQKRYEDAFEAWSRLSAEDKATKFKEIGQRLFTLSILAKKFRVAASVAGDLNSGTGIKPVPGQVTDGSFENGIKMRNAGTFEWNIDEGTDPQIGLSAAAKRSGNYSLWLTFDSFESKAFRSIFQTVAVVPGATYEFEGFYRADIKSKATFKWEVIDPTNSVRIAVSDDLALAGDWTTLRVKFTVPESTDGVLIRFIREGCGVAACPVTGKIAFDDLSLKQ